jgi:GH35 family endo-1,4-beta-xylanase
VAWAFQQAKRVFPAETLLEINEGTGTNGRGSTSDRYFQLINGLVDQDMGVRSIGFQFHLYWLSAHFQGKSFRASQLLETYERFGQLGLPLFITEITIPSTVRPGADGEALQAEAVANLYRLWFSASKMAGIVYWNLADGAAHGNEGRVLAGLLDDRMREKPAYQALYQLIKREWNTQAQTVSDAQGKASFRGFYGAYDVVARIGDKTQTFEIVLASNATNPHKLTLK